MARIVESKELNSNTRLLTLEMGGSEELNFIGGQYIIVNTNIPLPGNKIAKRAYSVLSSDNDQSHFNIAVRKVGEGPGSNYMHHTQVGSELYFSGPWGQFSLDESAHKNSAMVIATDTGITAALGLVQGKRFKSQVKECSLIWLMESPQYFIPETFVRNLIIEFSLNFNIFTIPAVNGVERLESGLSIIRKSFENRVPEQVFLSGDGALLYPFKEEFKSKGLEESKIKIECFFNNPFKKVVSV